MKPGTHCGASCRCSWAVVAVRRVGFWTQFVCRLLGSSEVLPAHRCLRLRVFGVGFLERGRWSDCFPLLILRFPQVTGQPAVSDALIWVQVERLLGFVRQRRFVTTGKKEKTPPKPKTRWRTARSGIPTTRWSSSAFLVEHWVWFLTHFDQHVGKRPIILHCEISRSICGAKSSVFWSTGLWGHHSK